VLREDAGRLLLRCNCCPVQLDLGPVNVARAKNRTPSGWLRTGADSHHCPQCWPRINLGALFAHPGGLRAQPLL
jgi:hypothetical protein